jgi:RNA recognition motif-containing protein
MESVRGAECLEKVKKLRDFAFVHFSDRESAKAAMDCWNSEYDL